MRVIRRSSVLSLVLAAALLFAASAPAAGVELKAPRVRLHELAEVGMATASLKPIQSELRDLDGDGEGDLVVLARSSTTGEGFIRTYRGDGKGYFQHVSNVQVGVGALVEDMVVTDLDHDPSKFPDVAIVASSQTNPAVSGLEVYSMGADCVLNPTPIDTEYGLSAEFSVAAIDLESSGYTDLMVAERSDGHLHGYSNDGHGNFTATTAFVVGGHPIDIVGCYIDSDGLIDFALLDQQANQVQLYEGGTAGLSDPPDALGSPISVGANAEEVVVSELDWQNLIDISVLADNTVNVLISNGNTAADGWSRTDYPIGAAGKGIATFYADSSTPHALAVVTVDSLRIRFNNGDGTFGPQVTVPQSGTLDHVASGLVNDTDMKGDFALCDLASESARVLENWFLPSIDRIFGDDRYRTAEAVSEKTHPYLAQTVVIATGEAFPDALAGVPLAFQVFGPILLTKRDKLPAQTVARIKALGADSAYVLGGEAAVSPAVESQLVSEANIPAGNIKRLAGSDRYETAYEIAKEIASINPGYPITTAYVATGEDFPDALAGAIPAAWEGVPVLLTRRDSLPSATKRALNELPVTDTVVLGGKPAVSDGVYGQLPSPVRIYGSDRYETAVKIAEYSFANLDGWPNRLIFATGENFPDALAGGLMGMPVQMPPSPMLLVKRDSLPASTASFVTKWGQNCSEAYVIGGTAAVSDDVVDALDAKF